MITRVYNREQFLMMCFTKLEAKNPVCAELGVLRGDFSKMILDILKPARLHLVDPFRKGEVTYNEGVGYLPVAYSTDEDYEYVQKRFRNNKTIIFKRMPSFEAVYGNKPKTFDLIYHDASHLYGDVKRDLKDWLPKLKPNGLMCGHDYIDHPSFGVKQAVDEFCKEHNFEMIIFNSNGGDYALRAIQ